MLAVSKLAVGMATVAIALSASVVAAAAFSGTRPTDLGHAVKVVLDRCQIEASEPGSQIGPCVSSFVPSGLPLLPTVAHPGDSSPSEHGRGGSTPTGVTLNGRVKNGTSGTRPTPAAAPSQIPIVTGQPATVASGPTPVPTAAAAQTPTPTPAPTPTPTPTATPTPTPTPPPTPAPTTSPTAAAGSRTNPDASHKRKP